jgi:aminopeptidase
MKIDEFDFGPFLATAKTSVSNLVKDAIEYTAAEKAIVVFDSNSQLSQILAHIYKLVLPNATFMDFDQYSQEEILEAFELLGEKDFAVLIQSTNFRLNAFRIRVELFAKSIKVVEHVHLGRMQNEDAVKYLGALAYDKEYFHGIGHGLKKLIDSSSSARIVSGENTLHFPSPLEKAKINIGDYSAMKNVGGQFPIGEVFTESVALEDVNGIAPIFAFGGKDFAVVRPETPILLDIQGGKIVNVINSTESFDEIMEMIKASETEVWVRELGFGLNKGFTQKCVVNDVGTYERMLGVHLSLGKKHTSYNKTKYFRRKETRYHIDVFIKTDQVYLDQKRVFDNQKWVL